MARVRLTWNDANAGEDGVRIYRALSEINPDALPAPIAEVPVGVQVYEDKGLTPGVTYHYYVATFSGASVGGGVAQQQTAVSELPRMLYASDIRAYPTSAGATSFVQTLPDCRAGDLLVVFGMRRAAFTSVSSGWTNAGNTPDGSYAQWGFAYWRIADGSEGGTDFVATTAAATYVVISAVVFRLESGPISCSTLALQRQTTGTRFPITVTNGASPALLFAAANWVYALSTGTGYVRDISRGIPTIRMEWVATHPTRAGLRLVGIVDKASAGEAVSINATMSTSDNSAESASVIWLAIREAT